MDLMSNSTVARSCVEILDKLRVVVASADAFGPEARALYGKLAELRPFLDELSFRPDAVSNVKEATEAIHVSLQSFQQAVQLCSSQGPLQVLLTGADLLHQMVNSAVTIQRHLASLNDAQLPTVVMAQARMLAAELSTITVDFTTLRRLHSACIDLQEEAERVRVGQRDDRAFASLVSRLAASCSAEQLLSDAAFLQERLREAQVAQPHQAVMSSFYSLGLGAVRALASSRGVAGGSNSNTRSSGGGAVPAAARHSAGGVSASPQRSEAGQGLEVRPLEAGASGEPGSLLEQLSSGSISQEQRAAVLEALRRVLQGQTVERAQALEALAQAGPGVLVRVISTSPPALRCAALRVLAALLAAEPSCAAQLVAARGVQVLAHLLTTLVDEQLRGAVAAAQRAAAAAAAAASASVRVAVASPLAARKAGTGASPGPDAGGRAQQPGGSPEVRGLGRVDGGSSSDGGGEAAAEVCLQAIAVLRQLFPTHMAEVLSSGALKPLCRAAGLPEGGRLAVTAMSALADAATKSGEAAVQMLQGRMLVVLADALGASRPSEAAAALACVQALTQHPARLLRGAPGHAAQDSQLCADMGRACDAASTTVLLDLIVGAEEGVAGSDGRDLGGLGPALLHLLPFCLHSPETRAAAMRHTSATRLLLRRVAAGAEADGETAALALRRLAADEASKTAIARQLSQALTACPSGAAASRQTAALACCLADVIRPASRDRAESHWAAGAAIECEQCSAVRLLVGLANSPDGAYRAAGLSCLHALAVHGPPAVRTALGEAGAVVVLVDAVKLETVALPSGLRPPPCVPNTLGQAAVEALGALATASEALRKDVCMQLCPFLTSASTALAASACHALLVLLESSPSVSTLLVSQGALPPIVTLAARAPGCDTDAAAPKRAVSLLWALCRGGGPAVDAAVNAGAARALLQRVSASAKHDDLAGSLEAAAVLGPLLRKSAAVRDGVSSQGGVGVLLELARAAPGELPLWEEAMAALAALAALHASSRGEATRALRQMLVRGTPREVTAAAVVVGRMSSSPPGREALLAEDVVEPLVRLLTTGDERAKAAAANAIGQLAVPPTVQLPACPAAPAGGAVKPRVLLVRAGAVPALLGLLRQTLEPFSAPGSGAASSFSSLSTSASASSRGSGAAAVEPTGGLLLSVTEALESLACGEEGAQAIRAAGGTEVLKEVVARGKRRVLPPAVATAASNALLQCIG